MKGRVEQIMSALIKIASRDFNFKYKSSEKNDDIDAIGIGLDMVAEQLEETIVSKEKYQRNEKKYKSIFENSSTIILNIDPETTKVLEYNKYSQEFYGFTTEQMDNLIISEIAHQTRVLDLEDGKSYQFNTKHRTKYGDKKLAVNAKCYKGENKLLLNVIMFDITEQKTNEEKLIANEQKYKALFDNSIAIVLVADPKTSKLISYNKFAQKFYGFTTEEMDDLYLKDITISDKRKELRVELASLKSGDVKDFETVQRTNYGPRTLETSFRFFSEGDKVLVHILMHDITYRKENEHILIQARKNRNLAMLEAEEKERKRISQELHDGVGQDLTAVKLILATLKKSKCLGSVESELLIEAKRTIEDSMSNIRKITQNLVPSILEDFGLAAALLKMIERVKSVSDIKVGVIIDPSLPKMDVKTELMLYRIAQESVNNAIKHSKCTGLTIQLAGYSNKIYLKIKDDGIGFEKTKDLISGLGLYSIEERCKALNGKLIINTSKDEGTEIIVEL